MAGLCVCPLASHRVSYVLNFKSSVYLSGLYRRSGAQKKGAKKKGPLFQPRPCSTIDKHHPTRHEVLTRLLDRIIGSWRELDNLTPHEFQQDNCDWHSVQDEEHILLDCPHELLVSLRTQHCQQLVFPSQYEDSPLNQPDLFGVASFVAKCQALFPWFFQISFWFGFRLFPSFRSEAPQRRI